jgi:hypothetical protein
MTRERVWPAVAIVAAAVASVLIARAGRPTEGLTERPDEAELYEMLGASDLSSLAEREGLVFEGISVMLPPREAAEKRHWLVYAGFGGRPGRHRIAYQIGGKPRTYCESDDLGWECFGAIGDVVVQGEAMCLRPRCAVTKRDALTLRRIALDHLEALLDS